MSEPTRAGDTPAYVEIEEGTTYSWCACGLSKSQPFCDGSHSSTDIKPIFHTATETKTAALCQCKQTKNPPFCDGSHNNK